MVLMYTYRWADGCLMVHRWWRLDGYDTCDEVPEAADPEAPNEANSEGETMGGATSEESESDNDMHDYRDY